MNDDLKKIIEKIRAILAKTTENGATEAEAMLAARMARQLMDKHQLSEEQILFDNPVVDGINFTYEKHGTFAPAMNIATCVAEYCDVKVWRNGDVLTFFGLESDIIFANFLTNTLTQFIIRSAVSHANLHFSYLDGRGKWLQKKSFMLGAINGINQKISTAIEDRKKANQKTSTGKDLIVVKNAIVEEAFAAKKVKLRDGRHSKYKDITSGSFYAGQEKGRSASLDRGIDGSTDSAKMIDKS